MIVSEILKSSSYDGFFWNGCLQWTLADTIFPSRGSGRNKKSNELLGIQTEYVHLEKVPSCLILNPSL